MCVCVSGWVLSSLQLHLLMLIWFWLLPVPAFPWRDSLSGEEVWDLTLDFHHPFFNLFYWVERQAWVCEREREREASALELCGGTMCTKWCQSPFGGGARQAGGVLVLGVPSARWHAGRGRREGLGEVARGRSGLDPVQSFLRAIGLFHLGRAGKLLVGCVCG